MSKIRRSGHSAEGETLSAGRVEYLEAARARVRTRRIRRTVVIVAVLTILVLFATGAVGSSIARAKDLVDTAVIALAPAAGCKYIFLFLFLTLQSIQESHKFQAQELHCKPNGSPFFHTFESECCQ